MRADAATNRATLLTSAWREFSQHGPQASLRAIAAGASVGIATLYRHFPTREDLLLGVVEEVNARVTAVTQAHLACWEKDPTGHWSGFVHDLADLQLGTLITRMAPFADEISDFGSRTADLRRNTLATLEDMLDMARHSGLTGQDLDATRFFSSLAIISRPLPSPADDYLPDDRRWLVDVLLRGLAPSDGGISDQPRMWASKNRGTASCTDRGR